MSTNRNPSTIFPDLPRDFTIYDAKRPNEITPNWKLFFDQMVLALQTNFSGEGILLPKLDATQIANIQAIYTPLILNPLPPGVPDITGKMIFDVTNSVPKVFIINFNPVPPNNITAARWWTFTIF